nr:immunoglobulin heavy chain junction region [Macaca mulatta]MOX59216.1 immunoglobulin heavy chain junction region [Macaca mulatta]MOX59779.1 immunoglobulin heavy chain junction region [Macaca mulatta]MOX59814.1 immunoglobulin heavy chain junction region [Macaca mulatta]MOX60130.1 immunoglobulin heavy chain junction region [Macaca mulatta]
CSREWIQWAQLVSGLDSW